MQFLSESRRAYAWPLFFIFSRLSILSFLFVISLPICRAYNPEVWLLSEKKHRMSCWLSNFLSFSYQLLTSGTLVLKAASPSHAGMFQCFVENVVGQAMRTIWLRIASECWKKIVPLRVIHFSVVFCNHLMALDTWCHTKSCMLPAKSISHNESKLISTWGLKDDSLFSFEEGEQIMIYSVNSSLKFKAESNLIEILWGVFCPQPIMISHPSNSCAFSEDWDIVLNSNLSALN